MKKRKWLSLLLAVMMLVSAVPFFPGTADAADGTVVEVSTWAELKRALEYTTNCSVVKVVKDIETKSLSGNTGLHQTDIIFMSMAMDKAAELKNSKVFNMIVLGGLLKVCPIVSTDGLNKALFKTLPERHHGLIPLNMKAVEEGMKIMKKM